MENRTPSLDDGQRSACVWLDYSLTAPYVQHKQSNGNVQYRYYAKAGRIVLLKTESRNHELIFAEGYVYGADGRL